MNTLPHAQVARVTAQTDQHYSLALETGETINWPRTHLPNIAIGDTVALVALTKNDIEQERALIAKHVLNQMLSGESP